jgi:hypothetical protein
MMKRFSVATAVAFACVVAAPAFAHVVVGARTFPVTLTFDDPGVGDEATLPQFAWQPGQGQDDYQLQWEFDKTITPTTSLIYNQGFDILRQAGMKTRSGFENVAVTGKWQAITVPSHEFVASFGIIREFSGSRSTVNAGGDEYGATSPTLYFGKGFGDLPVGFLRPFAVTGEVSYNIPDRRENFDGSNSGSPLSWSGSVSLQYSLPYLQSEVQDIGLKGILGRLIPTVELDWSSPAFGPAGGNPSQLMIAPGVIMMSDDYQMGLEALIPANNATGHGIGAIFQVHYFFDDLFPNSLGKPLVDWFSGLAIWTWAFCACPCRPSDRRPGQTHRPCRR